jgi:hypothetical protein
MTGSFFLLLERQAKFLLFFLLLLVDSALRSLSIIAPGTSSGADALFRIPKKEARARTPAAAGLILAFLPVCTLGSEGESS